MDPIHPISPRPPGVLPVAPPRSGRVARDPRHGSQGNPQDRFTRESDEQQTDEHQHEQPPQEQPLQEQTPQSQQPASNSQQSPWLQPAPADAPRDEAPGPPHIDVRA
jgi:hypothetical protein